MGEEEESLGKDISQLTVYSHAKYYFLISGMYHQEMYKYSAHLCN